MNFFFFLSMCLHVIFFALQHSEGIFFRVDGVEKVGISLLLLATLAAGLFNFKKGVDSRRVLVERFISLSCGSTAKLTIATPPQTHAFPSRALP